MPENCQGMQVQPGRGGRVEADLSVHPHGAPRHRLSQGISQVFCRVSVLGGPCQLFAIDQFVLTMTIIFARIKSRSSLNGNTGRTERSSKADVNGIYCVLGSLRVRLAASKVRPLTLRVSLHE